jgi:hypothetical protein
MSILKSEEFLCLFLKGLGFKSGVFLCILKNGQVLTPTLQVTSRRFLEHFLEHLHQCLVFLCLLLHPTPQE